MTKGFCVVKNIPYEGQAILEYDTKRQAEEAYLNALDDVTKEYIEGVALVVIEVIKWRGEWK